MRTFVEIGSALVAVAMVVGQAAAQLPLPPAPPPTPLPEPLVLPAIPAPAGLPPAPPVEPAPLPAGLVPRPGTADQGRVLLLENDRLLEGEIERIGNRYRIRRPVGELWIPCDRARRLCRDLDEAFVLMQGQANLRDADERLRLARWCHSNGLKDRALSEARIALDMRPDHPETVQFVQMLQRLVLTSPAAPKTTGVAPASATVAAAPAPPPALDISDDVFVTFSGRVQPILMNACWSCHHPGKSTSFVLQKPNEGNYRTSAQRNLAAVLEHVNVEKTVLSPLLIKSVVAHGGATQAPLRGRQSVPFQTMQGWVDQLVAMNPHLREIRRAAGNGPVFGASTSAKHDYGEETRPAFSSMPSIGAKPTPLPVTPPSIPAPPAMPPLGPMSSVAAPPLPTMPRPTSPGVAAPTTPPMPRDPFDADEFNRQGDPRK